MDKRRSNAKIDKRIEKYLDWWFSLTIELDKQLILVSSLGLGFILNSYDHTIFSKISLSAFLSTIIIILISFNLSRSAVVNLRKIYEKIQSGSENLDEEANTKLDNLDKWLRWLRYLYSFTFLIALVLLWGKIL